MYPEYLIQLESDEELPSHRGRIDSNESSTPLSPEVLEKP
jgi:hypothetical protein